MSLGISLVLEKKGLTEAVYGHVFPLLLFLRKHAGKWVMHGEISMSVRSNGTSKMIFSHFITLILFSQLG